MSIDKQSDESESSPVPVELNLKYILGLTTNVVGNCLFLTDDVIVYPVSGVIVIHDTKIHSQKFIRFTEQPTKTTITAMDLNPINFVLAVATTFTEQKVNPAVSFYNLKTLSLMSTFEEPEDEYPEDIEQYQRRRFTKLRFLNDNENITVLAVSESDSILYYYNWNFNVIDVSVQIDNPVADMAVNPTDATICCFVGKDLFRLMTRTTDNSWNQYGFREAVGVNFTCVCWLCSDRCLSCTTNGWIVLMMNGQLQAVYHLDTLNHDLDITMKMTIEDGLDTVVTSENQPPSKAIRKCVAFQYGLVLVVGDSNIYYFQKVLNDNKQPRYLKICMFEKPPDTYLKILENTDNPLPHYVESVFVSPNCKIMICITKRAQMYWASLDPERLNREYLQNSPIPVQPFGEEMHFGGIRSMSICLWKPNLMTCGLIDNTVKVWNYVTCRLLFSKNYTERVTSVSIHPTGLYSVTTFMSHVEYQIVQLNNLIPMNNFQIIGYNLCSFSDSGSMFALGKVSAIDVYNSITFKHIFKCEHNFQIINKLVWTDYDRYIVALHTNTKQQVKIFETKTGKLVREFVSIAASTDMAVAKDEKQIYIISKNGKLKEYYEQEIVSNIKCQQGSLYSVAITKTNSTLFIAAQKVILTVVLPILYDEIEYKEYKMHNHSITKLCLATDGSTLVSYSEDGSLCIWEVKDVNKMSMIHCKHDVDDILVDRRAMKKMDDNIQHIKVTVNKMETKCTLAINDLKKRREQEIQYVKQKYSNHLNHIAVSNKGIIDKKKNDIVNLKDHLQMIQDQKENRIIGLKSMNNDELSHKLEINKLLKNKLFPLKSEYQIYADTLLKKHNEETQKIIDKHKKILEAKDEDILKRKEKIINEKAVLKTSFENTKDVADKNFLETKKKFIVMLQESKELYFSIMGKFAKYKMQYNECLETIAKFKNLAKFSQIHIEEINQLIKKKHTKVTELNVSLKNCKVVTTVKEEKMMMIRQNEIKLEEELNKLKLNNTELQTIHNQLTTTIQEKRTLNEQLKIKYNTQIKIKKNMEKQMSELSKMYSDYKNKFNEQNEIFQNKSNLIKQMKNDFDLLSDHSKSTRNNNTKQPVLNSVITFQYPKGEEENVEFVERLEYRNEFFRQMQHLQQSIINHKNELKLFENENELYYLLMDENMKLIEEINNNRNIAKEYLTKYKNLKMTKNVQAINKVKKKKM